jgi:hypothetical protein
LRLVFINYLSSKERYLFLLQPIKCTFLFVANGFAICWAQAHFGEKARCGGKKVGKKSCEVCMKEKGKERQLVGKAVDERKTHMQRRKARKDNMQ